MVLADDGMKQQRLVIREFGARGVLGQFDLAGALQSHKSAEFRSPPIRVMKSCRSWSAARYFGSGRRSGGRRHGIVRHDWRCHDSRKDRGNKATQNGF